MIFSYPDTVQVRIDFTEEETKALELITRKLAGIENELELRKTAVNEFEVNGEIYGYDELTKVYNMLDDFLHGPIFIE